MERVHEEGATEDLVQGERPGHPSVSANLPTSKGHQQDERGDSLAEPGPASRTVRKK